MSDLIKIKSQLPVVKVKNDLQLAFPHQMFGPKYKEWLTAFTDEEAVEAALQVNAMRGGNYSVLPRICPNLHRCPMSHSCPFKDTDNVPVGLQCPLEQTLIVSKMSSFMEEFNVDGNRAAEFMLLNRLVELDLYDFRINAYLANIENMAAPIVDEIAGSTPQGEKFHREAVHLSYELKERISREKMKLLDILVQTPQARVKKQAALKETNEKSVGKSMAHLNQLVNQLNQVHVIDEDELK